MASPFQIVVQANQPGLMGMKLGEKEATKVSELLQADLEKHHVFFNAAGFHDHIMHHLLTLYTTGATVNDLQIAYDRDKAYQVGAMKPREALLHTMETDWDSAKASLGKGSEYASFLRFFQNEMEKKGYKEVLLEYLFKDDERGRDMQGRLFGGLLHPLIQLSYGLEWEQPAIIAAGLAQAAVHPNYVGEYLTRCHATAASNSTATPMGSVLDFYLDVAKNHKLTAGAEKPQTDIFYDGILGNAMNEIIAFANRVRIQEDELAERTAEMLHISAYVCALAAFHPPNVPKFDFFLLHQLTSAPFFLTLNEQSWVPAHVKTSFLESKIRMDILEYLARGYPTLANTDSLRTYTPKDPNHASLLASSQKEKGMPQDLLPRIHSVPDDGHAIKVSRAMLLAQRESQRYADKAWIQVMDEDTWLRMQFLLLDSVEHADGMWVRGAGVDEAWKDIPKQDGGALL